MGYLLDTNVVSELRKRDRAEASVRRWYESVDDGAVFLSVLVVGELRRGIALLHRRDPSSSAALERWLRALVQRYEERILPVTVTIADRWGRLSPERPLPPIDGLLAATALVHGLTLVTRNAADVERSGADVFNPFPS